EPRHLADPPERLGQVWLKRVVFAHAPGTSHRRLPGTRLALLAAGPLLKWNAIEDVDARGDHQAGDFAADGGDDLTGQPRAILKRATVWPGPALGGQQLIEQIPMALLDINELKAGLVGEPSRGHVMVHQPPQVVVVDQRKPSIHRLARRFLDDGAWIEDRIVKSDQRPAVTVPAGMRQLQTDHQ